MEFQQTSVVRIDEFVVVTFQGEGGEEIAVKSRFHIEQPFDSDECVEKACVLLTQAVNHQFCDASDDDVTSRPHSADDLRRALESPAVKSYQAGKRVRRKRSKNEIEAELDNGLKASFPASDPVSPTTTVTAGIPAPSELIEGEPVMQNVSKFDADTADDVVNTSGETTEDKRKLDTRRRPTPSPETRKFAGAGPAIAEHSKDAKAVKGGRLPAAYVKDQ